MVSEIYVWQCKGCTWYRARPDRNHAWDVQMLDHPVYGRIPNRKLYDLDIANHNCKATREVRIKNGINPDREYKRGQARKDPAE